MVVFLFIITSSIFVANVDCSVFSKVVLGQVGEAVTLPCKYDIDRHGLMDICWGRHESWFTCESTIVSTYGLQMNNREAQRFSLAGKVDRGDVSLTIKSARTKDAGLYVCRIKIPGPFNDVSHSVYLFIRNGLDSKTVTQSASTIAKQEKQVNVSDSITTFITEEYITPETSAAEVPDINIGKAIAVVSTEETTIETFVINVVRMGAIVFIPGLIIALLFRLRRFREQSSSRGIKTLAP